jgi:hypothetical protein
MTRPRLQSAAASLGLAFAVAVAALVLAELALARQDRPAVVALGSGDAVSVLITAGGARLLVPAGDQPSAFGNAWRAWAVVPLTRRVDVLALPSGGDSVANAARSTLTIRQTIPLPGGDAGQLGLTGAPRLDMALRIKVGDSVAITLEQASDRSSETATWRLVVEHGSRSLVVLPDGPTADRFAWPQPVAALILLRGPVGDSLTRSGAAALMVPARVSGKTLRTEASVRAGDGYWARRVSPGEAAPVALTDEGLRFPDGTDWYDAAMEELAQLTAPLPVESANALGASKLHATKRTSFQPGARWRATDLTAADRRQGARRGCTAARGRGSHFAG